MGWRYKESPKIKPKTNLYQWQVHTLQFKESAQSEDRANITEKKIELTNTSLCQFYGVTLSVKTNWPKRRDLGMSPAMAP